MYYITVLYYTMHYGAIQYKNTKCIGKYLEHYNFQLNKK